jgi:hypothetical protein
MILKLIAIDSKYKRKKKMSDKRIQNDHRNNRTMTTIETLIEISSSNNQNDDSRKYFTTMLVNVIKTNDIELT